MVGLSSAPRVGDVLRSTAGPSFSFEFFPPKTDEGEQQLWLAIRQLEPLNPTFVSVTYGAGGTTRERTARVTERIATETSLTPVAHLTCVGHSRAELRRIIGHYAGAGVRNLLALRGDSLDGPNAAWSTHPDGFDHAIELVQLANQLGDFCVGVAAFPEGHPHATDRETDHAHLIAKLRAGAEFAVTQFFFDPADYFRLRDAVAAAGCDALVLPGVMPITNVVQIQRFAELSGAAFPSALADRLLAVADDPVAVREIGVEVATDLSQCLLAGGAPGVHFYTMNRSTSALEVLAQLR